MRVRPQRAPAASDGYIPPCGQHPSAAIRVSTRPIITVMPCTYAPGGACTTDTTTYKKLQSTDRERLPKLPKERSYRPDTSRNSGDPTRYPPARAPSTAECQTDIVSKPAKEQQVQEPHHLKNKLNTAVHTANSADARPRLTDVTN